MLTPSGFLAWCWLLGHIPFIFLLFSFFSDCPASLGVENEMGCLLFIVVLEDKIYFELICLKISSKL